MLPRAMMGEGYVAAATPHPFEFVGAPLCPLPQGARARQASAAHFGQAGRSINLRVYEIATGAISIVSD